MRKAPSVAVLPPHLRSAAECVVEYMSDNLNPDNPARGIVSHALTDVIAKNPTYFERLADPDVFFDFIERLLLPKDHQWMP